MRRFAESLRLGLWFRRQGGLYALPWFVWVVAASVLFIGGSLTASIYSDRKFAKILCFTCQDDDVGQRQSSLKQHIQTMVRAFGLPLTAYQATTIHGRHPRQTSWQVQRHRIALPTQRALVAFDQQLQNDIRHGPFEYLARRERTNQTTSVLAITIGIDGVATDVVVLVQPQTAMVDSALSKAPANHNGMATPSARMAIVIDDMGWDLSIAQALLDLDIPLSFALMPQAPYKMQIAAEAQRHGYDILLHLPMEPHDYPQVNPGKDALLSQMSPHELSVHLDTALRMIPTAIGVNNHMGSRLTEDEQAMHVVMRDLKQHNLFFLDSRTSSASQAYRIAREVGLKAAERNVFLDHDMRPERIAQQLQRLAALAQTRGHAIGIGHPYPATLHALKQALPALRQAGITLVPVSQLVH